MAGTTGNVPPHRQRALRDDDFEFVGVEVDEPDPPIVGGQCRVRKIRVEAPMARREERESLSRLEREELGPPRIIRYGFYRTTAGKRRRYRCLACGTTFSSTKGTPYYRLQHRRATFDTVVALRVEGVSLSAIARIEGLAWNTVARWLDRAAAVCRRFSHGRVAGVVVEELQADEIRSFTGGKHIKGTCRPRY